MPLCFRPLFCLRFVTQTRKKHPKNVKNMLLNFRFTILDKVFTILDIIIIYFLPFC